MKPSKNCSGRRQFLKSAVLGSVGLAAGGIGVKTAAANGQKAVALVEKGSSDYRICLSSSASPSEKRGAEELQKFIAEMSGARLPIVTDDTSPEGNLVLVGKSSCLEKLNVAIPFETLGPEGFMLRTAGNHVVIAGGRQRGTMYGVYTFLEKLGCRWLAHDCSVIPPKPTIMVPPLDETQRPAFEYREPFSTEAFDKDWAARNKVNGNFADLDATTGGKLAYFPFVHTAYEILPPAKYFPDHPEYYALVDAKRRDKDAQLCLTNPDVLHLTIETVREWINQHPEAGIFSVSQNDCEGWCECDSCQQVEKEEGGAHSGPLLRFVNAVAAEIAKTHPDKLIDTLAYWYTETPPAQVRPLPNVRIRLCPIGVCEAHPYENCPNDTYFLKNLRSWSKITNQLYIWHYNTNFSHYLLPFPDFDELAADIPLYQRQGVVGLFLEGDSAKGGGAENAELRSYVMARLLWNTQVDVNEVVNEFMRGYYGKAMKPMRAYFDLLHKQVRPAPQGYGHHMWIYTDPGAPYLSEGFLAHAAKLFREAHATAADDATRARVRKAKLSLDYVNLVHAKAFTVRDGTYGPANLEQLRSDFQSFMKDVRSFGITELHEASKLDVEEEAFAKFIKPYRVVTLENPKLRVDVVPGLSGRIIHLIDKATGRNVLRHADLGETHYPDAGGLAVTVHSDYFGENSYPVDWTLTSPTGAQELVLSGVCSNGLKLRYRIRLQAEATAVVTDVLVENAGAATLDAIVQLSCNADLRTPELATLVFRSQAGKSIEKKLIEPEREPTGTATYDGQELPDGAWKLTGAGSGLVLENHFSAAAVSRSFVQWTGKTENRATLGLWSAKRALAPGGTLTLESSYEITRQG